MHRTSYPPQGTCFYELARNSNVFERNGKRLALPLILIIANICDDRVASYINFFKKQQRNKNQLVHKQGKKYEKARRQAVKTHMKGGSYVVPSKHSYNVGILNNNKMVITVSRVFLIGVLPFHHVMKGAGLEPITSHWSWYGLSADNGRFSPLSLIHNGRTGNFY